MVVGRGGGGGGGGKETQTDTVWHSPAVLSGGLYVSELRHVPLCAV